MSNDSNFEEMLTDLAGKVPGIMSASPAEVEAKYNKMIDSEAYRFENLSRLSNILSSVFKFRNSPSQGRKWVEIRKSLDFVALNYKEGWRKQFEIENLQRACETDGSEYELVFDFKDYRVALKREFSDLILNEKDLIADIVAAGHNVVLIEL